MALEYILKIEQPLDLMRIAQILADKHGLEREEERLWNSSILIRILSEDQEEELTNFERYFGFRPSFWVWFRFYSGKELERGTSTMIHVAMTLMQYANTGDVVLLFNYEIIVFQRFNNKLIFNQQTWDIFIASAMASIEIPYELKELSSPFL